MEEEPPKESDPINTIAPQEKKIDPAIEEKAAALLVETVEDKKKKSLRYSIAEGTAFSINAGFGEGFIAPLAIALNASNLQLGLISSLPPLLGAWAKLVGVKLLDSFKVRKKVMLSAAILNGLTWIPIAATPFVFGENAIWALLVFFSLYHIFGAIVNPSWNSLMGDLVGEKDRGSFFGKRNGWVSLGGFMATLTAGYLLHLYGESDLMFGFVSLFAIALVFRMLSVAFMSRLYEPPYEQKPESYFSLTQFVKAMPNRKYGYFTLFVGLFMFTVGIANPFFAPHMLQNLHFSYVQFTLILSASILTTIFGMPHWGKLLDDFGTRSVMILSSFLIVLVPLLWTLSGNFYFLFLVEMFSGFVWAGFTLSTTTYLFDSVTPQKRARCAAYHSIVIATLSFFGGIIGANAANNLGPIFSAASPYLTVFGFSAILRLIVAFFLFSSLKEVRQVQPITERQLFFKAMGGNAFSRISHDIVVMEKHVASEVRKEFILAEEELEKIAHKKKKTEKS